MTERKFLLQPDPHDKRDFRYKVSSTVTNLPDSVDLRSQMPPEIFDQGSLGSCTANAIVAFFQYLMIKAGLPPEALSRLFLYWQERNMEGTVGRDSGAFIRDGMRVLAQIGVAKEKYFPYDISTFTNTPSEEAVHSARDYRIAEYHRVAASDIFSALAEGNPVVIGITLWSSFYNTGADGKVPIPDTRVESILGGHAMLMVGYDTFNGERWPLVRNSWGKDWGKGGYCYFPPYYVGLINDGWTGVLKAKPEDFSFRESVDIIVAAGIFDSPDYWYSFADKYKDEYVALAFQKVAAYLVNETGIEK